MNHLALIEKTQLLIAAGDIVGAEGALVALADTEGDAALVVVLAQLPPKDILAVIREYDNSKESVVNLLVTPQQFARAVVIEKQYKDLTRTHLRGMVNSIIFREDADPLEFLNAIGDLEGGSEALADYFTEKWDRIEAFAFHGSFDAMKDTGELLSASTLKRLWGYVSLKPIPRLSTLDVLCRYIGKRDFKAFCNSLKDESFYDSGFFSAEYVDVRDLKTGAAVTIGWNPNRLVCLKYLGESEFEVVASENSKLLPGDRFQLSHLILGYPLYISSILRDGKQTPSFVAARSDGLNLLKVE